MRKIIHIFRDLTPGHTVWINQQKVHLNLRRKTIITAVIAS